MIQNQSIQVAKIPIYLRPLLNSLYSGWKIGTLEIELPHQNSILINAPLSNGGEMYARLKINNWRAMRRILFGGDIGLFEGYRDGDWETDNLYNLLILISQNLDGMRELQDKALFKRTLSRFLHLLRPNNKAGSRKNIYAHYDIGNSFFDKWLDESMTYSAAIFDKTDDLYTAQEIKYQEIAKSIGLRSGQRILEIGCGWGGFAVYAASNFDVKITCVTISKEQYEYCKAMFEARGLKDKIALLLQDYRDIDGQFDAIVSIEMFEAVGEAYWQTYFSKLKSLLVHGGNAGLQIITIRDDLFEEYRNNVDFIQTYIFPGGMLPAKEKLIELSKANNLIYQISNEFGMDYFKTLLAWQNAFDKAWKNGQLGGFDDRFKKLWDFYLAYCAAGFYSGRTDVIHLKLTN